MLRRLLAVVAILSAILLVAGTGCHTVKGVGKDVEAGGRAIQRGSGK